MLFKDPALGPGIFRWWEGEPRHPVGCVEFETDLVRILDGLLEWIDPFFLSGLPSLGRLKISRPIGIFDPFIGCDESDLRRVIHAITHSSLPIEPRKIAVPKGFYFSADLRLTFGSVSKREAPGIVMSEKSSRVRPSLIFLQGLDLQIAQRD